MKNFMLFFLISCSCFSQQLVEPPIIIQSPMSSGEQFGSTIAVSGNYAVIGSAFQGDGVYVYEKNIANTWILKQKLTPPDVTIEDGFGGSVAISGNTVIVGANNKADPDFSNRFGAVYIFEKNVNDIWEEKQVLFRNYPADTFQSFGFGQHVAIDENVIIVGGAFGVVSVYAKNSTGSWEFIQDLKPHDGVLDDDFGRGSSPIAISDDIITIGNFRKNDVYTYSKNGSIWQSDTKIPVPDTSFRGFGDAVALNGNELVIGAPFDGGNVAFYTKNMSSGVWEEKGIFTSNTPSDTFFGDGVALSDSYALVSGFDSTEGFLIAHLIAKNSLGNWEYVERKNPSDGFATVEAKSGLAITENNAFVGTGTWEEIFVYDIDPGEPVCTDVSIPDTIFEQWLVDEGKDSDALVNGIISSCDAEKITEISINSFLGITDLTGIEAFINLETLNIPENDLVTLDLSKNTKLITVSCFFNLLEEIDITNCTRLVSLNVSENFLTDLDISGINNLRGLNAISNTNLSCIQVKDLTEASTKSSGRRPVWRVDDPATVFSLNCPAPLVRLSLSKNEKLKIRNKQLLENNILVFPTQINDGKLTIIAEGSEYFDAAIYNLQGNLIKEFNTIAKQREINVSTLSSGLYVVKIHQEGKETIKKFIIGK